MRFQSNSCKPFISEISFYPYTIVHSTFKIKRVINIIAQLGDYTHFIHKELVSKKQPYALKVSLFTNIKFREGNRLKTDQLFEEIGEKNFCTYVESTFAIEALIYISR